MTRYFTAAVLSAALAISGLSAAPARADASSDRAAKLILGAIALYGVARSIDNNGNRSVTVQRYGYDQNNRYRQNNRYDQHSRDRDRYEREHRYDHGRRNVLPSQCLTVDRMHRGARNVIAQRCLSRFGYRTRLPRGCSVDFRDRNGRDEAYDAACLLRNGYVIGSLRR